MLTFESVGGHDTSQFYFLQMSKAALKEAEDLKKEGVQLEYNPKEGIKILENKK